MAQPGPSTAECADVLDLTNSHLSDLSSVTLAPGLTALDLTANRLKEICPRVLGLKGLRTLNMRQNLLPDAAALDGAACKSVLEDLELRDNLLTQIPHLQDFPSLTRLEFSYNQIRSLAPLGSLGTQQGGPPPLQELYLAANKVGAVEGLSGLTSLRVLELGSNRIRDLVGLSDQAGLQELWLGRNRLSQLDGLEHMTALRRLSLQSNRLESMAGVGHLTALEELYLSHNGITQLDPGLTLLTRLKVLDVSSNKLTALEHLTTLTALEDLWLNDNALASLDDIEAALSAQISSLTTIYLEGNPAAAAPEYRSRLLALLPALQQLDADVLPPSGTCTAAAGGGAGSSSRS